MTQASILVIGVFPIQIHSDSVLLSVYFQSLLELRPEMPGYSRPVRH